MAFRSQRLIEQSQTDTSDGSPALTEELRDLNLRENSVQVEEGGDIIDPAMHGIANNSTLDTNTFHSSGFIKPLETPRKKSRKKLETAKSDNERHSNQCCCG
ncbi:hypothetical protein QE152_g33333 [Popillia japonica]|uniref:Uncharacterized protein n=1 Tax=Popillia japonica TaxID=7064 RepID=A0AAW1IX38_POPJA